MRIDKANNLISRFDYRIFSTFFFFVKFFLRNISKLYTNIMPATVILNYNIIISYNINVIFSNFLFSGLYFLA